jgi:NAD(P)-dependent dehydrogenase (short-subunit alcohol dehydrogenase family)
MRNDAVEKKGKQLPPQEQGRQPGRTKLMRPQPEDHMRGYEGSGKLAGKAALITGGDSGIGRATAIAFAKEGADIAIVYLEEEEDAMETARLIEDAGGETEVILLKADIGKPAAAKRVVEQAVKRLGKLDILVNNAGEQHPQKKIEDITPAQLEKTFRTNIFGMFYVTQAALPYLKKGSAIVNTASITAYQGHEQLLDYSATKGAIVTFTRSLSKMLAKKGIRVNAVAPGPIWTPLIPSTFTKQEVAEFGKDTPLGRPGQPDEVAPSFVFLASDDSSYMTGQVLHPNGGTLVGS